MSNFLHSLAYLLLQAIGARNQLKSIAKQRESQKQQLQALIAEKKMQLERHVRFLVFSIGQGRHGVERKRLAHSKGVGEGGGKEGLLRERRVLITSVCETANLQVNGNASFLLELN